MTRSLPQEKLWRANKKLWEKNQALLELCASQMVAEARARGLLAEVKAVLTIGEEFIAPLSNQFLIDRIERFLECKE
jgi:hypothetical protein